ncbi:dihydrolipoyl dehydrogenase [Rhizobium sp. SSA_523]|uniref:dihydrolipoyl dehydrogenase n=1 Tax=Rhizobium sp. SSA_523 TaxID=2952477 RepID=UPI0020919F02|nr:dihydrolipoyl dehydrogenase [Rhizobium sp. SSA_523]MCO5732345.1 dihydrolipoyl dehydrogenase [Rhizobium sp. SSA_523]WKC21256.1 dihydrolipoyl dehydrogenase [Rhizobium sp. SSA_523]
MTDLSCDVLVIGAGPGGYVAAIRAGQLGQKTIIVEKQAVGGTCLNIGCIPSKALIHAADEFHCVKEAAAGHSRLGISAQSAAIDLSRTMSWKDGIVRQLTGGVAGLLRKAGVDVMTGMATVLDGKTVQVETGEGSVRIACQNLVIATGSTPVTVPALPFGGDILSSTEALALTEVPESLAVVGGGYIGLEIGTAFAKLGARVSIIEAKPHILPHYDEDLSKPISARLKALGVSLSFDSVAQAHDPQRGLLSVRKGDAVEQVPAEKVLVTVGRKPALQGFGLESLGLDMQGPFLRINDRCQTSMRGVYAIGDVTGEPMLAHRAMAQGELVADVIAGHPARWDKRVIPAVCFTDPEVVVVGMLPAQAKAAGHQVEVASYPMRANGRALTLERSDGFVRIVHEAKSGLVLGFQAVGAGCAELVGEFGLAVEMCATVTDLAATIHAHPTLSETLQEVALSALGKALHA